MFKILIVDDNSINLVLFTCLLERSGYEIITAINGLEAISTALEQQPDLIVMDLMMPVMDGFEATLRLKADPATQHIPIIVTTADDSSEAQNKATRAGCDHYMLKPIRAALLDRMIKTALQSASLIKKINLFQPYLVS